MIEVRIRPAAYFMSLREWARFRHDGRHISERGAGGSEFRFDVHPCVQSCPSGAISEPGILSITVTPEIRGDKMSYSSEFEVLHLYGPGREEGTSTHDMFDGIRSLRVAEEGLHAVGEISSLWWKLRQPKLCRFEAPLK